jgi:hypothetical protein
MNIAVIGHGNVGGTLAKGWAAAGHEVVIGARDQADENVRALTESPNLRASGIAEAAAGAEVVLVATPPTAAPDIAAALRDWGERVLIDATNTMGKGPEGYATAFEAFSDLTNTPHVVKCFNTTGFENMAHPVHGDLRADMFMASDSEHGKSVARQLALDLGFAECYDFGGAAEAGLLEAFAKSWINLAIRQGLGRNMVLKLHFWEPS